MRLSSHRPGKLLLFNKTKSGQVKWWADLGQMRVHISEFISDSVFDERAESVSLKIFLLREFAEYI